jgi:predicted MFS family arabinose efflux permease
MRSLRDYAVVSTAYWAFTVTDGALRMLVLLYLHDLGYSPIQIASLFLFYEFFGVVTNLVGGWLGARVGLTSTLFAGLALQVVAVGSLTAPDVWLTVPYVMAAQALSGVAKDLTKMSSKSYVKLVVAEGDSASLMKWVSILTGSKNTLKGVGFFVGAALLAAVGFRTACAGMAGLLALALIVAVAMLPWGAGRAKSKPKFTAVLSRDPRINWLSAARFFLFGSRDVWFVLALPIYLGASLGWSFYATGAFLALWVIGYGFVQAAAPRFTGAKGEGERLPPDARSLGRWTAILLLPLAALVAALLLDAPPGPSLIVGLAVFGVAFAANSAVHSYLVVHYAEEGRVSLAVGFYYMANAAGRFLGTLLSGVVFQLSGEGRTGLVACLLASIVLVAASRLLCTPLQGAEASRASSAA